MLFCIPISVFAFYDALNVPGITIRSDDGRLVVAAVPGAAAQQAGARVGDVVDQRGMSAGERARLVTRPVWRGVDVPLRRDERHFSAPLGSARAEPESLPDRALHAMVLFSACVAFILAAVILWRRPGPIALVFAAIAIGSLAQLPTTELLGFLPEPWYTAAVVATSVAVETLPGLALIAFVLRFPHPLEGERGTLALRISNVVIVLVCLLAAVRVVLAPTLNDAHDLLLDTLPPALATCALVAIVFVRYAGSHGDDRRRIGWLAVGSVLTGIAYFANALNAAGALALPDWARFAVQLLQTALPIAFAYAILRHRVIDLGFAINRTVVYGIITGSLVVSINLVEWLSAKLLAGTGLTGILDAALAVGFGVALNWFHGRVERAVERVLFRHRYIAAQQIEQRIRALGFATTTASVDEALVPDVVAILHIGSAAIFRPSAAGGPFERSVSHGWDGYAREIAADHLLPRMLRADERSVLLQESGIVDESFPRGNERPDVAIPVVVRHDFLGFVLYGHRHGETAIDPEELSLLERLVAAGAIAYDAIDAAEWRRRALALEASIASR
jgi:hypothetical protein